MRIAVSLRGDVKQGKIKMHRKNLLDACIKSLEGKPIMLTIEQYSAQRSNKQNAYIHALFTAIMEHCGYLNLEEVKFNIKIILGYYTKDERGFVQVVRTHLMNKIEAYEFSEKVRAWAHTDLNLYLPTPEEYKILHPEKYGE